MVEQLTAVCRVGVASHRCTYIAERIVTDINIFAHRLVMSRPVIIKAFRHLVRPIHIDTLLIASLLGVRAEHDEGTILYYNIIGRIQFDKVKPILICKGDAPYCNISCVSHYDRHGTHHIRTVDPGASRSQKLHIVGTIIPGHGGLCSILGRRNQCKHRFRISHIRGLIGSLPHNNAILQIHDNIGRDTDIISHLIGSWLHSYRTTAGIFKLLHIGTEHIIYFLAGIIRLVHIFLAIRQRIHRNGKILICLILKIEQSCTIQRHIIMRQIGNRIIFHLKGRCR